METVRPWKNKLLLSLMAFWATVIASLIYFDIPFNLPIPGRPINTRLVELTWADPGLKQDIAASPVSIIKSIPMGHFYEVDFKITNLLQKTRCFLKLDLRPAGVQNPPDEDTTTYVRGRLKNEALVDGFKSVGYTFWVITSGEKIIGSGYLDSLSVQDKKFVKLHETVEIKTNSRLKGPLPGNAKLHIILDSME